MTVKPGTATRRPTSRLVARFERENGIRLPREFVAFLDEANGAIPETGRFKQGDRERLVERFLCLLDEPEQDPLYGIYDIDVVAAQLGERLVDDEGVIGVNVVPIAALFGGDMVCLDFRSASAAPVVAVWDHERSQAFRPSLETVAGSFRGFLEMLHS